MFWKYEIKRIALYLTTVYILLPLCIIYGKKDTQTLPLLNVFVCICLSGRDTGQTNNAAVGDEPPKNSVPSGVSTFHVSQLPKDCSDLYPLKRLSPNSIS